MNHNVEEGTHRGVVCLFCGKATVLPAQVERRLSANPAESGFRASILRCHLCGKEALYLPEEIVNFQAA